jgi:hypothetical protein
MVDSKRYVRVENIELIPQPQIQRRVYERAPFYLVLLTLPLMNPWARGDGVGYHAFACAA